MTRGRRGFTLIELLIVVVIIGLLAAIAIPKFSATKERAFVANMRSDLRNLATSQEAYFGDNNVYYGGSLPSTALLYSTSPGVSITVTLGTSGWGASATSTGTTITCALYIGDGGPLGPATVEGQVACN
ncbi:MAG: prepilin-type N-terminal cleavage/methylation domain-containing protein [Gemmatimonadales bacterium]|nr:prepilin-type N-terminal cleavage/methylation domain-containing protein [Gemmatimonadales bacterium]MDZ4390490.1 prepilin-type N-terminal cleavage/methylation domain-containing protein [Gemmatimonadales bacterium]